MTEPGTAEIQRLSDGTRVVTRADTVIRVASDFFGADGLGAPCAIEPDGTLRLDTEGLYRYRFLRSDGKDRIYERITEADPQETP